MKMTGLEEGRPQKIDNISQKTSLKRGTEEIGQFLGDVKVTTESMCQISCNKRPTQLNKEFHRL